MLKMIKYEIKKSMRALFAMVVIIAVFFILPQGLYGNINSLSDIGMMTTYFGLMCAIYPFFVFSYKMIFRASELQFAQPVSRRKVFLIKYVCGFATILVAYLVTFIAFCLFFIASYRNEMNIGYLIVLYPAQIFPAYIIYSISTFFYTRANTVLDGVLNVFLSLVLVPSIVTIVNTFLPYSLPYVNAIVWCPLDILTTVFQRLISSASFEYFAKSGIYYILGGILNTMLSIFATWYMFAYEKRSKVENCGNVSKGVLSFETFVPIIVVGSVIIFSTSATMIFFIFGVALVVTMIYKRNALIGKKTFLNLIISVALGLALYCLSQAISTGYAMLLNL